MDEIRRKVAGAVALAVVLPMLIVVYLMTRWAAGNLDSPATIVVLVVLAFVLIGCGLNILRSLRKPEPPAAPSGPNEKGGT